MILPSSPTHSYMQHLCEISHPTTQAKRLNELLVGAVFAYSMHMCHASLYAAKSLATVIIMLYKKMYTHSPAHLCTHTHTHLHNACIYNALTHMHTCTKYMHNHAHFPHTRTPCREEDVVLSATTAVWPRPGSGGHSCTPDDWPTITKDSPWPAALATSWSPSLTLDPDHS